MPIYGVYAKIIRHGKRKNKIRNVSVLTFRNMPIDYWDLRQTLLDAAKRIYYDHQQTVTEIEIHKHLKGKYLMKNKDYRPKKLHYRRQLEMKARLTYSVLTNQLLVERVTFGTPDFYYKFKADYDQFERKKPWELPKIHPPHFEAAMLNQNMLSTNNLMVKTSNYGTMPPKDSYGSHQERTHKTTAYPLKPQNTHYGRSPNDLTITTDELERENIF